VSRRIFILTSLLLFLELFIFRSPRNIYVIARYNVRRDHKLVTTHTHTHNTHIYKQLRLYSSSPVAYRRPLLNIGLSPPFSSTVPCLEPPGSSSFPQLVVSRPTPSDLRLYINTYIFNIYIIISLSTINYYYYLFAITITVTTALRCYYVLLRIYILYIYSILHVNYCR
jgi:hypothetical protein